MTVNNAKPAPQSPASRARMLPRPPSLDAHPPRVLVVDNDEDARTSTAQVVADAQAALEASVLNGWAAFLSKPLDPDRSMILVKHALGIEAATAVA